ncbi:MAG: 50S ribosomal protein L31e [Nitrososphaeria archaeon]
MSQAEREYVIPLHEVLLTPKYRRAEKAVYIIRSFVARHMRTKPELVKLDPALNDLVWSRGIQANWRRIKVKVAKEVEEERETYRVSPS